jgi:hypothetical protein
MRKPRGRGRPGEFEERVRLTVFLDAEELARIQAVARAERLSASRFARQLLVAAVARRRKRP